MNLVNMEKKTRKVVKETLGETPENVKEVEEGLIHETFTVEVGNEEYIVQFSRREDGSLKHNVKCYELFQNTVPVPEPVTEEVETLEGEKYAIVEKLEGESAENNVNPQRVRRAGRTLAKIHGKASFPHEGWMELKQEDKKPEELLEGLEIHEFKKKSLKKRKMDNMYDKKIPILEDNSFEVAEQVKEFLRENEGLFPEKFEAVPAHLDFSPDNVIYSGDQVSGVIDFDYMYAGLDIRDLAKSANSFWMHDPAADWDVRETFYEGYRQERELPEGFEELEAFFRIETLARLIASVIELDEMEEEEKEFYRRALGEELERCRMIIGSEA
jgi:Ser/Thr protein kinase RdoA (MazF antagonist)